MNERVRWRRQLLQVNTRRRFECTGIEQRRREARDRLEISDIVIRGNLIQGLMKPWD